MSATRDATKFATAIQELVGILEDAFAAKGLEDTGEEPSGASQPASMESGLRSAPTQLRDAPCGSSRR